MPRIMPASAMPRPRLPGSSAIRRRAVTPHQSDRRRSHWHDRDPGADPEDEAGPPPSNVGRGAVAASLLRARSFPLTRVTTPPPRLMRRPRMFRIPARAHMASSSGSVWRSQNDSMLGPRNRPVSSQPGPARRPAVGRPMRVQARQACRAGGSGTPKSSDAMIPPGRSTRASSTSVSLRVVNVAEEAGMGERISASPSCSGSRSASAWASVTRASKPASRTRSRAPFSISGLWSIPSHRAVVAAGDRDRDRGRPAGHVDHSARAALERRRQALDHGVVPPPVLPEGEDVRPAVVIAGDAREQRSCVILALRDGHAETVEGRRPMCHHWRP